MKRTILTFDIGTTAIKTCLFDEALQLLEKRTDEYDLIGESGIVEQESEVYWQTMCRAVASIRERTPLDTVEGICLTTQGETLTPVDRDGKPLHRSLVWLDDRAGEQAKRILQRLPVEKLYRHTGITDMNGFVPLAKLLWFKEQRPEIYEATDKFLLLEDYLLHRLTGRFVTEKCLLTSTAYYDIRNDCYWDEALDALGLDKNKLPQALECGELVGTLTEEAARTLGLACSVKVFTGAMDQIAAALGGGGLVSGVATATIGTAMVLTSCIDSMEECAHSALTLYRGFRKDQYVLLPYCSTAGAVFKWFKDQVCSEEAAACTDSGQDVYDLLCAYADEVQPGADGVILLPYFAGSLQPELIPEARGVFFGLDITTGKKTMTRAVLESMGYMLRENLQMLGQFGLPIDRVHFFGGGAKNPIWNQIIADITGAQLVLLEESECGSMGAAMLGAVSLGWYPTLAEAQKKNGVRSVVYPDPTKKEVYDRAYARYQQVFHAVKTLF